MRGKKQTPPGPVPIPRFPPVRLLLLAVAAVAMTVAAIVRYYQREPQPMLVPTPPPSELPAPSVIPLE